MLEKLMVWEQLAVYSGTTYLPVNKHDNNCRKSLLLEIIRLQIFHNCFIKTYMNRKDPSEWMSPDCVVMCAPILLLQWHPRCSKFRIRMMKFNAKITICRPWKSTNKVVVQLYRTHWVSGRIGHILLGSREACYVNKCEVMHNREVFLTVYSAQQ